MWYYHSYSCRSCSSADRCCPLLLFISSKFSQIDEVFQDAPPTFDSTSIDASVLWIHLFFFDVL